jgi:general secretion pathway protein J
MNAATRAARGFTLLEVLLAVTLLALLIAGAYGGIRAAARAMHAGERAIDRTDRLRTAQQFLRRQLSHVMPLAFAQDEGTAMQHVFEGDAEHMRFVAPMPGYLSRGGPYVQTLELVRADDGLQLKFTDAMLNGYDAKNPGANADEPVVVLDHIRDGAFEYRTLDEQGRLTDWLREWPDPQITPMMVRIRLTMQPGVPIAWPVLDVPLKLNAGAARVTVPQTLIPARRAQ